MLAEMKQGLSVAAIALATALAPAAMAMDGGPSDDRWIVEADLVQVAQMADDNVSDPLEGLNRVVFDANEFLYGMFLRGPTEIYTGIVPPPLRSAVSNILHNLTTPVILANDILQWEWQRAGQTLQRFAINTTYGIGGMFDRASEMGIERHSEDFGQTLAVWGVPEPFYLVLPVLGPSNPRDAVGKLVVDRFFDPLGLYMSNIEHTEGIYSRAGVGALDEYSGVMKELDQIKKTSVDYYAAIRSMYRQKRNAEIRNGAEADLPPIPDLGYELAPEPGAQPASTGGEPKARSTGEELGADPARPSSGGPVSIAPFETTGAAISVN